MADLTIIVPFYNEARTIGRLVQELELLPPDTFKTCIFVDDGSTDSSVELLEAALISSSFDYRLLRKANGGKSSAIQLAAHELDSTHVLILDADLELDTEDVLKMWKIVIDEKSDVVFGFRRFVAQSSFTYRFARGNQAISNIYGILYNEVITDIMCGFKLIPSNFLRAVPFKFSKFAIEVEIPLTLWLERIRPYEIEVAYSPRSRDEGKIIGLRDAVQVVFDLVIFRIQMRSKRK